MVMIQMSWSLSIWASDFTLNMSRLAWWRRSSGRGVVLGLDASLSDRMMTSGEGVLLSWSVSLRGQNQKAWAVEHILKRDAPTPLLSTERPECKYLHFSTHRYWVLHKAVTHYRITLIFILTFLGIFHCSTNNWMYMQIQLLLPSWYRHLEQWFSTGGVSAPMYFSLLWSWRPKFIPQK